MFITDGYLERKAFNGAVVEYRPMLRDERDELYERAEACPREQRNHIYDAAMRRHIHWASGELSEECRPELLTAVMGLRRDAEEVADCDNLYRGTLLQVLYPCLPSCQTCQMWQMNPLTGEFQQRGGQRVKRQSLNDLLCRTNEGCPKGSPENPYGLSRKNRQALAFDLTCRAVGEWPDDAIVRRNARVIGLALQEAQRRHA